MDPAFEPIEDGVGDRIQPDINTKTFDDDENDNLGDEWQQNSSEQHDIDNKIEGCKEDDHHLGLCGLKTVVDQKISYAVSMSVRNNSCEPKVVCMIMYRI